MFNQFFKAVAVSFFAGVMIVLGASALSCSGGTAEAAPSVKVPAALVSAEAACQAIVQAGAKECSVIDFNPSLDIVANLARPEAVEFCKATAKFVQAHYKAIAGKTWSVRVIHEGSMTPSCIERVR